ncbi:MAG: iron-sulfur cluster carrier protein ApbC [Candidatus Omnitrophica bacterium]|nr:iron-sulfur cluster carrier protein ApbC [Candidatus Omnitrophota bacterium]
MTKVAIREEEVLERLRRVNDPELNRDLVSLGMIKNLAIDGGKISFLVELTTPACPLKSAIESEIKKELSTLPGFEAVTLTFGANVRRGSPELEKSFVPGVKNVIAVASGKGGVGKSTVSVNLAIALAQSGAKVGLLDADLYGPNVPLMMGISDFPKTLQNEKIVPPEKYGLKLMSIAFFMEPGQAVIWRGPMLHKALQQFLGDVAWGELDYLVVDLPPGTGDVQLSLSQSLPLTCVVLVTTPQDVALLDVEKAIFMFQKVNCYILGVVENMSNFICPHCEKGTPIFGEGGGEKLAKEFNIPLLGQIPLVPEIREGGDSGRPIVIRAPKSEVALAFQEIAGEVAAKLSVYSMQRKGE